MAWPRAAGGRTEGAEATAGPAEEGAVTCATCRASCCRLEVLLVTDTGVPERHVAYDRWGAASMARLEDGWCSALDRSTMLCTIYDRRPLICREFEMGGRECLDERGGGVPGPGAGDAC